MERGSSYGIVFVPFWGSGVFGHSQNHGVPPFRPLAYLKGPRSRAAGVVYGSWDVTRNCGSGGIVVVLAYCSVGTTNLVVRGGSLPCGNLWRCDPDDRCLHGINCQKCLLTWTEPPETGIIVYTAPMREAGKLYISTSESLH